MNELQVIVTQKPAEITFNFDEIKQGLSEQMEIYKSMDVTEDVLAERKKDVATLRKMAKAIDDKRKEVKSGYMIPFDEFEKKAKELIEIINEPIELINKQVKEFDEKQKAEKKAKALEYFISNVGDVDIIFDDVFSPSWLLSATSFKSIKADIDTAISNRKADIETIKAMESEVEEKAMATYKATKRLADALKVINEYKAQKEAILEAEERRRREEEERIKREEEHKAREEQERLAKEQRERELAAERERHAEIERIRAEERAKAQEEIRRQHEEVNKHKEEQVAAASQVVDSAPKVSDNNTPDFLQEMLSHVSGQKEQPVSNISKPEPEVIVRFMMKGTETAFKSLESEARKLNIQFRRM